MFDIKQKLLSLLDVDINREEKSKIGKEIIAEFERLKAIETDYNLEKIAHSHTKTLLISCENALSERDLIIDDLRRQIKTTHFSNL